LADLRGIILRYSDFGESNKVYTVFTRELGKISLVARGVKSAKSKLSGVLQPFTYMEFSTIKGKGKLETIASAAPLNAYYDLRLDLNRLNAACHFAKLINKNTEEYAPIPILFDFFLASLDLLVCSDDPEFLTCHFEANLLSFSGYTPVLTNCINCGSTGSSLFLHPWLYFDVENGGVICPDCFLHMAQSVGNEEDIYRYKRIASGSAQIMFFMLSGEYEKAKSKKISKPLLEDLKKLLASLMDYYF